MRTLLLTLAILTLSATVPCAQDAPKSKTPARDVAPYPYTVPPAFDTDKQLVQDRWASASGSPEAKQPKKDKKAQATP